MAAYVILYATEVIDEELHAEFRQRATALLEARGGRYLMRGRVAEIVGGDPASHSRIAVMEFETAEQAREWARYPQSPGEYAELRELRDRAANSIAFIVEERD